jgi:hypothetical protein
VNADYEELRKAHDLLTDVRTDLKRSFGLIEDPAWEEVARLFIDNDLDSTRWKIETALRDARTFGIDPFREAVK